MLFMKNVTNLYDLFNISQLLQEQLLKSTCRDEKNPTQEKDFFVLTPFPKTKNTRVLIIAAAYALLFFVGLYGNTVVLTYVVFLTRTLKKSVLKLGSTFIYVVALCITDSLLIFSIPMVIMDQLLGEWIFGTVFCKIYWVLESLTKFLSTFILTVLAFDRYLGVCHPTVPLHQTKTTVIVLVTCLSIAFLCLFPIIYKAEAIVHHAFISKADHVKMEVIKCSDNLGEFRIVFAGCTFVIGYLIPATLIIFCYLSLLCRVIRQQRLMRTRSHQHSGISVTRVTVNAVSVTVFYFICWTPYWASQLYNMYLMIMSTYGRKGDKLSHAFVYIMYFIHALPYVNSAFNWIFYARLNSQFRKGLKMAAAQFKKENYRQINLADCSTGKTCTKQQNGLTVKYEAKNDSCDPEDVETFL